MLEKLKYTTTKPKKMPGKKTLEDLLVDDYRDSFCNTEKELYYHLGMLF